MYKKIIIHLIKRHGPWLFTLILLGGLFFFMRPNIQGSQTGEQQLVDVIKDQRWLEMESTLSRVVSQYDGDVGIYVRDLRSGQSFERNADESFVCASLIKVPIMVAAFQSIKDGKLSMDKPVKYKQAYRRSGSGRLKWARTGTTFSVAQLIYEMITESDNTATAIMIDLLGYDYLNACFESIGLNATRIHPTGMSLASQLDPAKDNFTTPREMGTLLEKLYRHELVDGGLSDLMLEIMKRANHKSRLSQHLPRDWKFARKTGLLRNNCHDMGIVFTPKSDYVVCVLTGRNKNYTRAKTFIASFGRTLYGYMRTT